jgi:hypothetical protein
MATVCIVGIAIWVLVSSVLMYSLCVVAGKADDELEQKYGIRRS